MPVLIATELDQKTSAGAIADAVSGLGNLALAIALLRLVVTLRRDIPLLRSYLTLGIFITVCGIADLFDMWTFWRPHDATSIALQVVAAALAVVSAGVLTGSAPQIARVVKDGAERRRLEDALRQSEANYRLLLRATNDAIYERDLRGDRLTWNEAFQGTYRYRTLPADLTPGWWQERIHPDDVTRIVESLTAALRHGAGLWSEEYRFQRGDGTYAEVLDRALIVRDADREPRRMVGSLSDLSVRRQMQDQVRHAQRMEAVGRLAGGVAHEFNNVLTTIKAYAAFLQDEFPQSDPRRADAEEIVRAADRAAATTRQLLAYGLQQLLRPTDMSLDELVVGIEHDLRVVAGPHVVVRTELGAGRRVRVDRAAMEQVLRELTHNARKAMPSGGALTIRTREVNLPSDSLPDVPPGPYAALLVSDTGIGMEPEVVAHIFDPFFTTTLVGEGAGLGLASAYGIVRQSGGYIRVHSVRGAGTTFTIVLPEVPAEG